MKNQKPSLVYAIDNDYIPHFATSLTSLLRANPNLFARIFVIMSQPDVTQMNKAVKFFKNEFNVNLELLDFDVLQFEPSELSEELPKSVTTYFRMFIAELLPRDIEKVLYLDSDTVILGKLDGLVNQEFNNHYFYAVPECLFSIHTVPEKLLQENLIGKHYFNAGVMLIDVDKWRDETTSNQLLKTGQIYRNIIQMWDQDILNIHFRNQIGELKGQFNSFIMFNKTNPDPSIIHYAGPVKPWHVLNSHPYRAEYKFFRNQTPFKFRRTMNVSLRPAVLQFLHKSTLVEKIIESIKIYRTPK
jgi:lipopolysaccharide biosynthesis glycosyltransferase